jgi:hypothetical protein
MRHVPADEHFLRCFRELQRDRIRIDSHPPNTGNGLPSGLGDHFAPGAADTNHNDAMILVHTPAL